MQLEAGAEIVMIFDSAANQLNEIDFEKYMRIGFQGNCFKFSRKRLVIMQKMELIILQ
jgi:uroporphyrinogen-III decarboxylase